MVICPECNSADVGVSSLLGDLYWVRCKGCGFGWETGRWRPYFAEDANDHRGNGCLAAQLAVRGPDQPITEVGEW
jgi:hypothetical protein